MQRSCCFFFFLFTGLFIRVRVKPLPGGRLLSSQNSNGGGNKSIERGSSELTPLKTFPSESRGSAFELAPTNWDSEICSWKAFSTKEIFSSFDLKSSSSFEVDEDGWGWSWLSWMSTDRIGSTNSTLTSKG